MDLSNEKSVCKNIYISGTNILPVHNDLDLKGIVDIVLKEWRLLVSSLFIGAIVSLFISNRQPIYYMSESVLIESHQSQSISSLLSNLRPITSLAGLGFNETTEQDRAKIAMQLIKSRRFISFFFNKNDLLIDFYTISHWDTNTNTPIYNEALIDRENKSWRTDNGTTTRPTLEDIVDQFNASVTLSKKYEKNVTKLTVKHASPVVAKKLNDLVVQDLNLYMRDSNIKKIDNIISSLKVKLNETVDNESQKMIFSILDEQYRKKLLSTGQLDYVYQILDPAIFTSKPHSRKMKLFLLGMGVSLTLSLLLATLKSRISFRYTKA